MSKNELANVSRVSYRIVGGGGGGGGGGGSGFA